VKVTEDANGNARRPAINFKVMTAAAKDGNEKPDIKDTANWRVNVYSFDDATQELAKTDAKILRERGLSAKVTFELRVSNTQIGYTTSLTARSVVILNQSENNAEELDIFKQDPDVQEAKRLRYFNKNEAAAVPATAMAEVEDEEY